MQQLAVNHLTALMSEHQPPCVSLYQQTHRQFPDSRQGSVQYGNLLREVETSLRQKYPAHEVGRMMAKFRALEQDASFWNHRTDGLAVFAAADLFQVIDLQRPVKDLVIVADRFHTKPLLRVLQSADRYQVLCLDREEAKLFEGNRDALDPVDLSEVPSTLAQALGKPHQIHAPEGATQTAQFEPVIWPDQGGRKDAKEFNTEQFFRVVDRAIMEHHSRPSGLPLILATLPEYHALFRQVSHNRYLLAQGIERHPNSLTGDQLREEAWRVMEPTYRERLEKLIDDHRVARARDLASDDPRQVVKAALAGRVGVLLVEADREMPGRIDRTTGKVQSAGLEDPEVNDVLDELAQLVLQRDGEVVIVPKERMPSDTGVVATFRY